MRKKQEYKMHWEDIWLRRSELENAQELLWKFDEKDQVQRECKWDKLTFANKNQW